ncbi:MAG: arginine--tRNA ligase [Alphaproteobacteria bacterium]
MNFFRYFRHVVVAEVESLIDQGRLPRGLDTGRVSVDPPRDPAHGDIATNAALVLSKDAGRPPGDIAADLAERVRLHAQVASAEVAGPGFINLRLRDDFWRERLREVLRAGLAYGDSELGGGRPVNVEYVSTNPTGPLHIGHARGAVVGDVLAALLAKAGYEVTREYYINDAGAQVDALARSAHLRYREALGEDIGEFPEGLYPGEYLRPVGRALAERYGEAFRDRPESEWLAQVRTLAVDAMMDLIREDLAALGIHHEVFTSERRLVADGAVERVVDLLREKDLIYKGVLDAPKGKTPEDWEPRPQVLFRSTSFGDDVDRPLEKSDGAWTYFATDLAYHLDKYRRGFNAMIDVWGADHGGYVRRMQAGVKALSEGRADLDIKLCQLVKLLEAGEPAKMSKRAGTFVTVRDLVQLVGRDVVRFIMLTRKNDAPLDFDVVKVAEESRENPVFYVQYAHARCRSVLRHAAEAFPEADLSARTLATADLALLTDSSELVLIKSLAAWPRTVESAAESHEPHRLAFYLQELAAGFHTLWTKGKDDASLRFLVSHDRRLSLARLALVAGVATVIASGLRVMGVEPVEELRS